MLAIFLIFFFIVDNVVVPLCVNVFAIIFCFLLSSSFIVSFVRWFAIIVVALLPTLFVNIHWSFSLLILYISLSFTLKKKQHFFTSEMTVLHFSFLLLWVCIGSLLSFLERVIPPNYIFFSVCISFWTSLSVNLSVDMHATCCLELI